MTLLGSTEVIFPPKTNLPLQEKQGTCGPKVTCSHSKNNLLLPEKQVISPPRISDSG